MNNTFIRGLLWGTGFAIGLASISAIWIVGLTRGGIVTDDSRCRDTVVGTPTISINEHRLVFTEGKPAIYGSLRNTGSTMLSSVMVEGSIFDEKGVFLDKNTEYFSALWPKEHVGIKIVFHDWQGEKNLAKLVHKVRISQGYEKTEQRTN